MDSGLESIAERKAASRIQAIERDGSWSALPAYSFCNLELGEASE